MLLVISASVSSRFRSPVRGCQSVVAPPCMASRPRGVSRVWGGSPCEPSTLWRSEVAVLVAHSPQLGARRRGSSVSDMFEEAAVAPCAVSSSESGCCELLYLRELRVVLCKFSGYAP
ncbi:hypothetical protein Taro_045669 [Colocasia esculenta]|uniref:Uncharacterized protein n=1 Tax=Colocasia esculenta TaxID=4460 RepID=A0A843X342_COLES|nr:hypothetical protein [Colocasia esculenta]